VQEPNFQNLPLDLASSWVFNISSCSSSYQL